jgi:hypothetical protein
MLDELEHEHRKLSQLADKARQLRAQNAQMAQEVSRLPELKKAAAELQQQVVELQHVKQQIQRLQVSCAQSRRCAVCISSCMVLCVVNIAVGHWLLCCAFVRLGRFFGMIVHAVFEPSS